MMIKVLGTPAAHKINSPGNSTRPVDPTTIDAARFWAKVQRGAADECWLWTAGLFPDGYGQFWHEGTNIGAHRVAWALGNLATLLPGWVIRHDCDTPRCCNPACLRPGTPADNAADMVARGRSLRGVNTYPKPTGPASPLWREQCRRGHHPAHRYTTKAGTRRCRECDRIGQRARYHERKAGSGSAAIP